MKLTIFSSDGATSREQDFADLPTFEGDKGLQAVKEVIVAINANNRQGTHSTKTRGEVRGGGKKPWRQKGTGRARAGSIRSPLWSGGGVVFGPKPRDYSKKINAKVKALAFSRALFDRVSAGELAVIEGFVSAQSKTKAISKILTLIAPKGRLLLVDAPFTAEAARASRNIARVSLQEAAKLNTHDLAQYSKIIVSTKALEAIIARVNGWYQLMNAGNVLKLVRLTEKSNKLSSELGQYTFEVARYATKYTIAEAVEQTFKVTVKRVNVQNYRGKNKKSRTGRPSIGSDYKKAIVTLKAGDKIELV